MIVKETAKLEKPGHVPGQLLGVAELVQACGVVVVVASGRVAGSVLMRVLPSGGSLLANDQREDPRATRSLSTRASGRCCHGPLPGVGPAAATSAANSRRSSPASGCHCTPRQNRRPGTSTASTRPSSAHARGGHPGRDPVQGLVVVAVHPDRGAQHARRPRCPGPCAPRASANSPGPSWWASVPGTSGRCCSRVPPEQHVEQLHARGRWRAAAGPGPGRPAAARSPRRPAPAACRSCAGPPPRPYRAGSTSAPPASTSPSSRPIASALTAPVGSRTGSPPDVGDGVGVGRRQQDRRHVPEPPPRLLAVGGDADQRAHAASLLPGQRQVEGAHERHARPVGQVQVGRRVEDGEVGARADAEVPDVRAPQRRRAARGRRPERLGRASSPSRGRRARCRTASTR